MEQLPLILFLIVVIWLDLSINKIPNWLTLSFVFLSFSYHFLLGSGLPFSLTGVICSFFLLFPLFVIKFIAGGDVKMGMAIGSFVGWEVFLESLLYGFIIGLPLVLILSWKQVGWKGFKTTFTRYGIILGTRRYLAPAEGEVAGLKVPYGPALALGAAFAVVLNHFNIFTLVS
ncbi:peptidase A24 [Zobellella denitrificans]|uniref:Peptidase A24 n=1 Tax=Zobellella denitrificans TaxID=347534 RepID=A0A291HMQ3_9GAMM|nr:A24 family peptidase [Zobellella denitrificans]ATG73437.1 peptidase A24 [Zobellella denitrificans]